MMIAYHLHEWFAVRKAQESLTDVKKCLGFAKVQGAEKSQGFAFHFGFSGLPKKGLDLLRNPKGYRRAAVDKS